MAKPDQQGNSTLQTPEMSLTPAPQTVVLDHLFKAPFVLPHELWMRPCDAWVLESFDALNRIGTQQAKDLPATVTLTHETYEESVTTATMRIEVACATVEINSHTGVDGSKWSGSLSTESDCCLLPHWNAILGERTFIAGMVAVLSEIATHHGQPPAEYWRWVGLGADSAVRASWGADKPAVVASTLLEPREGISQRPAVLEFLTTHGLWSELMEQTLLYAIEAMCALRPETRTVVLSVVEQHGGRGVRLDAGTESHLNLLEINGALEISTTGLGGYLHEVSWITAQESNTRVVASAPVFAWLDDAEGGAA